MLRAESKARARALQLLYAWETTGARPVETLLPGLARLTGPVPSVLDGAEELAAGIVRNVDRIDRYCGDATDNWRLDRLAVIDRNVLRLGTYELMFNTAPPKVAIDEAVWLAHRFGGPQSAGFVNGVLDRVAHLLGRL
jgi:N utilization substance protein B